MKQMEDMENTSVFEACASKDQLLRLIAAALKLSEGFPETRRPLKTGDMYLLATEEYRKCSKMREVVIPGFPGFVESKYGQHARAELK